ncbi:hypothetical protein AA313_de0208461 [Arthrobotrys entomopaga]|nr:hypothetical protein AA313_de0208461 [Arthrobotrys entomopaga]
MDRFRGAPLEDDDRYRPPPRPEYVQPRVRMGPHQIHLLHVPGHAPLSQMYNPQSPDSDGIGSGPPGTRFQPQMRVQQGMQGHGQRRGAVQCDICFHHNAAECECMEPGWPSPPLRARSPGLDSDFESELSFDQGQGPERVQQPLSGNHRSRMSYAAAMQNPQLAQHLCNQYGFRIDLDGPDNVYESGTHAPQMRRRGSRTNIRMYHEESIGPGIDESESYRGERFAGSEFSDFGSDDVRGGPPEFYNPRYQLPDDDRFVDRSGRYQYRRY